MSSDKDSTVVDSAYRDALHEMQIKSQLCDITLIAADGTEMAAHRNVLAANSPYFHDRFVADSAAGERLHLADIDAATLTVVVEHLYTGRPDIVTTAAAPVHALLEAAAQLRLPALRNACLQLLCARPLRADTCLAVRRLAAQHGGDQLCARIDAFVRRQSEAVVRSPLFGRLIAAMPMAEAVRTLEEADGVADAEEEAAEVAEEDAARDAVEDAVKTVNGALQVNRQKQVVMLFDEDKTQCYDFEEQRWDEAKEGPFSEKPVAALYHHHERYVYAVPNESNPIHVYDTVTDRWHRRDFVFPVHGKCDDVLALLNGWIYSIGEESMAQYNVLTLDWRLAAPMAAERFEFSPIALNGRLYAIGGHNHRRRLATAESYDPVADAWQSIASMAVGRSRPGIGVLDGRLYVVGGWNQSGNVLKSAEVYEPLADKWRSLPDMATPRGCAAAVAHAGELYVMGGTVDARTVEVYSPATNAWRELAVPMPKQATWYTVACLIEKDA